MFLKFDKVCFSSPVDRVTADWYELCWTAGGADVQHCTSVTYADAIWLHVSLFLWCQEWEAGRRRERELAGREIERLRGSIQTVTRAANPLGKLMDFLQEDVDSMQRELAMWQRTNLELMTQLRMEHRCATFVCSLYYCVVCCCHTVSPW